MRPEVYRFAVEMERILASHDDRPGWEDESSDYLLERLKEEVDELEKALAQTNEGRPEKVFKEATDIANFAMMIADVIYGLGLEDSMRRSDLPTE